MTYARFGVFLLLLLTIIGCEKNRNFEFKIMSYNIKHGVGNDDTLDLSRAMDVIKEQAPDLLALQEIDHLAQRSASVDQTAFMAHALKMEGTFGKFMDFQGGAYGMASLANRPLISNEILSLPDGLYEPRASIVQELELTKNLSLLFANVHFDWISGEEGQKSRSAQASALITYLEAFDLPTVITGDFNCTPDSPTMQLFFKAGFIFINKGNDNLSFQGENKSEIDHVIYRNSTKAQFKVKSIDLLDEPLVSDHRPLVAKLEVVY